MSDYIKREDAIEIIARHDDTDGTIKVFSGRFVNGLISAIPPADVRENVKGQWLDYRDNPIKFYFDGRYSAHCSVCGYHPEYEEEMRSANFCPNCGADMRPISALSENVEIASNLKRGES